MKFKLIKYFTFVLIFLTLNGCTSVQVIQGVAEQNKRNSEALKKNIERYLEETEPLINGALEMKLAERYRKVGEKVNQEAKDAKDDPNGYAAYFEKRANQLSTDVDNLKSSEAQQSEKEILRLSEPLAAAVAFDSLSKEEAGEISQLFIEIVLFKHLDDYEKQVARYNRLKNLKPIADYENAKSDIVRSLMTIQTTINKQALNSVIIASQLKTASETSKDPAAFLKGVTENTDLYSTIATIVLRNTNDKHREKAAHELLDSLKEGETKIEQ
jgi:hypothetical protein